MRNNNVSNDYGIWGKWEIYSEGQKEKLLEEFRRKRPNDHFNKNLLEKFLREKSLQSK